MTARTEARELAQRLAKLAATNTLAAERDRAIAERDQAWRKVRELETALREARALGRCA